MRGEGQVCIAAMSTSDIPAMRRQPEKVGNSIAIVVDRIIKLWRKYPAPSRHQ